MSHGIDFTESEKCFLVNERGGRCPVCRLLVALVGPAVNELLGPGPGPGPVIRA